MVRAWLMCSPVVDQSAPCNCDPSIDVSLDELHKLGIRTQYIPIVDKNGLIDKMCEERGYKFRDDLIVSREKLPDYDEEIKRFFNEHMHTAEEVRYVRDGSGYFDVRDQTDKWVRIAIEPGDAIILPAGIFHRFTPDNRDYIDLLRLFEEPQEPIIHDRDELAKAMSIRQRYLDQHVLNQ